jgi:hypothetical protein
MSGDAVKQLQNYLISQGFNIPAGATGYYGEQTKQAVMALQQKLGVDNSTGPGYWGPRTIAKVSQPTENPSLGVSYAPGFNPTPTNTESAVSWKDNTQNNNQNQQQQNQQQQNQPTEYQTYFNQQRALGKTPEEISQSWAASHTTPQGTPIGTQDNAGTGTTGYSTGNSQLDEILKSFNDLLQTQLGSGKLITEKDITPQMIQDWANQASAELEPYYQQQFKAIQSEVNAGFQALQESYNLSIQEQEAKFRQNLGLQRETEASKGTAFSGGRRARANELVASTDRSLQGIENQYLGQGRTLGQAEKVIGSNAFGTAPQINQYGASLGGAGGLQSRSLTSLYNPITGITGSLERERAEKILNRKNQLKYSWLTEQNL